MGFFPPNKDIMSSGVWEVERALSSRAKCKQCDEAIDQGAWKIRYRVNSKGAWLHVDCVRLAVNDPKQVATLGPLASEDDISGIDKLSKQDRNAIASAISLKKTKPSKASSASSSSASSKGTSTTRSSDKKRKAEQDSDADSVDQDSGSDDEPPSKSKKTKKSSAPPAKKQKASVPELKASKSTKVSTKNGGSYIVTLDVGEYHVVMAANLGGPPKLTCDCPGFQFSKSPKSCRHCKDVLQNSDKYADEIDAAKKKAQKAGNAKSSGVSDPIKKKIKDQTKELQGAHTVDELKVMCKANDQKCTGTKAELSARVADGLVLGRIPRCPSCSGGHPKFDLATGVYTCPGFMDDDTFKFCNWIGTFSDFKRLPWVK
eukprot:c990_g1_i1.p1 GENE.c990_g1_i1~~c990_g1_i1.p1  ORF type:complete len:373 (+),score=69.26 c990_g1_i1:1-1119(+)